MLTSRVELGSTRCRRRIDGQARHGVPPHDRAAVSLMQEQPLRRRDSFLGEHVVVIDHCERLQTRRGAALLGKPFPPRRRISVACAPSNCQGSFSARDGKFRDRHRTSGSAEEGPRQHAGSTRSLRVLARVLVSAEEQGDLLSSADLRIDDARGEHAFAAGLPGFSVADCDPPAGIRQGDVPLPAASPAIPAESSTSIRLRWNLPRAHHQVFGQCLQPVHHASAEVLTVVSSLYNTAAPGPPGGTSSSKTGVRHAWPGPATISHWVEAGKRIAGPLAAFLIAIQGHPRPISQQGDHADGRVTLLPRRTGGQVGCRRRAAKIAAEALQNNRPWAPHGGSADQPHQPHPMTLAVVKRFPFRTSSTDRPAEARSEHFDLPRRPCKHVRPIAAVTLGAPKLGCWTWLRPGTAAKPWSSPLAGIVPGSGLPSVAEPRLQGIFSCGSIAPRQCRTRRLLNTLRWMLSDYHRRLLGLRVEENLPQPRDGVVFLLPTA